MFRTAILTVLLSSSLLPLAGCEDSADKRTSGGQAVSQTSAALPIGVILTAAPADPQNVVEARSKAKAGDEIVVQGRIGGQVRPFVEGRAMFQLVDLSLPTCNMTPGDTCETPWDYCCEPKDQLAAKSVTIQIVGDNGKLLAVDLNGQHGLKPMARVIVRGTVDRKSDEKAIVIQANGIYVDTEKPADQTRPAI